jgi:hypothetical protein
VEGKGLPACKDDNLTAIYEPTVQKMWEPRPLTPLWAFTARYRDSFTFYIQCEYFCLLLYNVVPLKANRHKPNTKQSSACYLLHVGFLLGFVFDLKMEAKCSSEKSVHFQRNTWRYIPEDRTLHSRRCKKHRSYVSSVSLVLIAS